MSTANNITPASDAERAAMAARAFYQYVNLI